jgi:hypothetical protein
MSFFRKLFGKKKDEKILPEEKFTPEQYDENYELKEKAIQHVLGKMHGIVGHAIIPFSIGGAVDMYYFPNYIKGTGFATMELLDPLGNGPQPNDLGTYELVAFTKEPYNESNDTKLPFNLIERRICGVFTTIGSYSTQAILKPGDTCELPIEGEESKYLLFDNYNPDKKEFMIGNRKHHLLLCMEIFRSEMDFARVTGSDKLFEMLKEKEYYPYSDLDREPVV